MARNPDATISDLLDAAARLFVGRPYDDIKLTDIAESCGVTKGAIYHHFGSKEDVFLSMLKRKLAALGAVLAPARNGEQRARERLGQLTALYLSQPLTDQRLLPLVRREAGRFHGETHTHLMAWYQAALPGQVEEIIGSGMDNREIVAGNAALLARLYVAQVEVYLADDTRASFENVAQMAWYATDTFLGGIALPDRPAI